jgi:hypothetical protein
VQLVGFSEEQRVVLTQHIQDAHPVEASEPLLHLEELLGHTAKAAKVPRHLARFLPCIYVPSLYHTKQVSEDMIYLCTISRGCTVSRRCTIGIWSWHDTISKWGMAQRTTFCIRYWYGLGLFIGRRFCK